VQTHNLARQGKADARALWLGGEEGDEYLLLYLGQYAGTIVCHVQAVAPRGFIYAIGEYHHGTRYVSACFGSVLQQLDEHLHHLCAVYVQQPVGVLQRKAVGDVLRGDEERKLGKQNNSTYIFM
jgi:hypothetical protein